MGVTDKKKAYKAKFEQHAQQKKVIDEIEAKIKQTKVNLVESFESWWQQNYGTTERDGDAGGVLDDIQDIGEQFDSMELDRLERIHPPGAVPFLQGTERVPPPSWNTIVEALSAQERAPRAI